MTTFEGYLSKKELEARPEWRTRMNMAGAPDEVRQVTHGDRTYTYHLYSLVRIEAIEVSPEWIERDQKLTKRRQQMADAHARKVAARDDAYYEALEAKIAAMSYSEGASFRPDTYDQEQLKARRKARKIAANGGVNPDANWNAPENLRKCHVCKKNHVIGSMAEDRCRDAYWG